MALSDAKNPKICCMLPIQKVNNDYDFSSKLIELVFLNWKLLN